MIFRHEKWGLWTDTTLHSSFETQFLSLPLMDFRYLRFKKLSIPPKLVTSFYVIIITSSWTTVASLIHLILKFTISKEKVSITALALFWSITILIAWIVTIIFFEIGLTHIPISDCPRRRKKWSFVCTEVSVTFSVGYCLFYPEKKRLYKRHSSRFWTTCLSSLRCFEHFHGSW